MMWGFATSGMFAVCLYRDPIEISARRATL
jgi:hypothetical protein